MIKTLSKIIWLAAIALMLGIGAGCIAVLIEFSAR